MSVQAIARVMLFVFAAQLLAASASAHAFADWLEHEQEHSTPGAPHTDGSGDEAPASGHHGACHASHHLQAFASFPSLIFFAGEAMPPVSQAPRLGHSASPHPRYKPPRQSS